MNQKLNLVYSPQYDLSYYKLEKLHVFDAEKWGKVIANLNKKSTLINEQSNGSGIRNSFPISNIFCKKDSEPKEYPDKGDIAVYNIDQKKSETKINDTIHVRRETDVTENVERGIDRTEYIVKEADGTDEIVRATDGTKNVKRNTDRPENIIKADKTENVKRATDETENIVTETNGTKHVERETDRTANIITEADGLGIPKKECNEIESNEKIKIAIENIHEPNEATGKELLIGHSLKYLDSLKHSGPAARVLEIPRIILLVPNLLNSLMRRLRYHVGGTILASELAVGSNKKWSINIGGGFHHASKDDGGGFCAYADISIAIKKLQLTDEKYKFLIIDLDAHQGNGHEKDFKDDKNVVIFDMFNEGIYPFDEEAKKRIDISVPLMSYTKDEEYLKILNEKLKECFENRSFNLIVYNAGTDCLVGDPLGRLSITREGIIKRDAMVFQKAKDEGCPIMMLTSGGYQRNNADVIADSIWNLFQTKIIS